MNQAMWISKTGLHAQEAKLQAIANNIANVNTVGYKRDRVVFEDLFYRIQIEPGAQLDDNRVSPTGLQLGTGTRVVGTQKLFTDGDAKTTNEQYDVAIEGQGFLQVELPDGQTAYTRAGQLQPGPEGILATAQGMPLVPEITIPEGTSRVTIGADGRVTARSAIDDSTNELGQLELASFVNPAGLRALGNNLYRETEASGPPTEGAPGTNGMGTLRQGALENSNVEVVEEMTEMMTAHRVYEMNTKVLSAADNMLQQLAQVA
ncbi:flagellar basal-body rod protein FlgG [Chitinasiproducens palmae]|uniref:Flagellar basal-body rod protein FlgG n=1 Tax=Chitinasiproducens palmae TaxID=1770053 RepID=A0A1H2PKK6_9BURK|nr:flagellar basal-body rod protein FlgG [Chitinasiproducens palmae]SDV46953.1 flagellar basal-body rod protein FlgG [Chitinasiproducens palmae]